MGAGNAWLCHGGGGGDPAPQVADLSHGLVVLRILTLVHDPDDLINEAVESDEGGASAGTAHRTLEQGGALFTDF